MWKFVTWTFVAAAMLAAAATPATNVDERYWSEQKVRNVLDKTVTLRLAPDLSQLSGAEQRAVHELLAAGKLLHELYLLQRHHQSLAALERLKALHQELGSPPRTERLLTLFRLFKGPIATTLENTREPFLPVAAVAPGKNVYPVDVARTELDKHIDGNPGNGLLDGRTVVRRATRGNAEIDLGLLEKHPALQALFPKLAGELHSIGKTPRGFYAVPYSLAYADRIFPVYRHLRRAADLMRDHDKDFAAYLENRARDLLANNYESGDAAWATGSFGNLNAQIGSYETYDDELYGAKTFFSLSLLLKDEQRSEALASALSGIQEIENSLPHDQPKKVRNDIPAGVYNVIADFGQARGTNTATILPNDADHARKYGRVILMRHNILTNAALFQDTRAGWQAVVNDIFDQDLTLEAGFQRTLWHEIGHYLGVSMDEQGRGLDVALQEYSDLIEEMKADLVALYAAPGLQKKGYYSPAQLRSLYADGIRRTLQRVKPRRDQPYQTMQLMQMNYFLENGVLTFDPASATLHVNYEKYHDVVKNLLSEVLAIQSAGDANRAAAFVDRYATWDDKLHGVLASNIREAVKYRYRLVYYDALDE